ncbi:sensor histidine kinase [Primorskyibacter sp. S187A]|uniref:sensor histidine kinase n=1 Tax=Primorskyibacter sp. S187A TaxID=3415130 RepID=UPI003C7A8551
MSDEASPRWLTGAAEPTQQQVRRGILRELYETEAGDRTELILRGTIIAIAGVMLYLAMGILGALIWGFGYFAILLMFCRVTGPSTLEPAAWRIPAGYFFALLLPCWYVFMTLYIMTFGSFALALIGLVGLTGMGVHVTLRHTRRSPHALMDIAVVTGATLIATLFLTRYATTQYETWAIATTCMSLAAYFVHSFLFTLRLREGIALGQAKEAQSQKMASLGQLTAGIAHDFNNILTVIRGNLDLHDAVDAADEKRALLAEARGSVDRAAYLVSQLLAFSRKAQVAPRLLNVAAEIAQFDVLARRLLPANVRLKIKPAKDDLTIFADPTLLQSALLNIATNARDAMAPNPGTLTLSARRLTNRPDDRATAMVEIVLQDSGPGVPDEVLTRLSEPFYTSKPVGKGSGLGLSMVQGFAEQAGGKLLIENANEGGLRLRLCLPDRPTIPPELEDETLP